MAKNSVLKEVPFCIFQLLMVDGLTGVNVQMVFKDENVTNLPQRVGDYHVLVMNKEHVRQKLHKCFVRGIHVPVSEQLLLPFHCQDLISNSPYCLTPVQFL